MADGNLFTHTFGSMTLALPIQGSGNNAVDDG
jgi:hypothetical protein